MREAERVAVSASGAYRACRSDDLSYTEGGVAYGVDGANKRRGADSAIVHRGAGRFSGAGLVGAGRAGSGSSGAASALVASRAIDGGSGAAGAGEASRAGIASGAIRRQGVVAWLASANGVGGGSGSRRSNGRSGVADGAGAASGAPEVKVAHARRFYDGTNDHR